MQQDYQHSNRPAVYLRHSYTFYLSPKVILTFPSIHINHGLIINSNPPLPSLHPPIGTGRLANTTPPNPLARQRNSHRLVSRRPALSNTRALLLLANYLLVAPLRGTVELVSSIYYYHRRRRDLLPAHSLTVRECDADGAHAWLAWFSAGI